ncbi:type II toxin-antitoxin system PemK/MazF family toxin [Limosilactobacillus reuteri]|nr:type II toxin-antitoxin system PemK/MazF family toxin [Limosilactobacillus reuteri]
MKVYYHQGDIVYMDFSPSKDNEIKGMRPAVIISSDEFNRNSSYLMVVPITMHGNNSPCYVELNGYRYVKGRVNTDQVHSYSLDRVGSLPMEQLRIKDFNKVVRGIKSIMGGVV